jgi:hypothetical protein
MASILRFLFAKPYRCRDCRGGEGIRSRRRTWTERYILPLFLMQPVRNSALKVAGAQFYRFRNNEYGLMSVMAIFQG